MAELKAVGCSRYRVGKELKVADATAKNWSLGGEPGYALGRALLRLHAEWRGAAATIALEHREVA